MSVLNRLKQLAESVASVALDMSQVSKGGAGRRLLPAGRALAQLIGYREFGDHVITFQGKAKAPARRIRLTFALWGKGDPTGANSQENCYHIVNEDGTPKQHGTFTTFDISLGNNEKAKIKHGFDKMNYKNNHRMFATMLGELFFLPITVKKGSKADSKPYNLIDWAAITPPLDPMTGAPYQQPTTVPDEDFFMFLWDQPTKEDWDAMFIDGVNDKGQSKNFLQGMCRQAKDFPGSPLEQLLLAVHGGALPDMGVFEADNEPDAEGGEGVGLDKPAIPAVSAVPSAPVVPAVPAVPTVPGAPVVPELPAAPVTPEVAAIDPPFDGGTLVAPAVPALPGM